MTSPFCKRAIGQQALAFDRVEARRALALLVDPAHSVELHARPWDKHSIHAATGLDEMLDAAERWADEGQKIYLVCNPVPNGIGRKSLIPDVVYRRWLFIDVDAVKPADQKDNPASEREHFDADILATAIAGWLSQQDWPLPVRVDSGNGHYLLYRLDLPNDDPGSGNRGLSRTIVNAFLKALHGKWNGQGGIIDKAVHNANRLMRLPGSMNAKGVETEERPFRPCRITQFISNPEIVTAAQVQAATERLLPMAASPPAPKAEVNGKAAKSPFKKRATDGSEEARKRNYATTAVERELAILRGAKGGPLNTPLNEVCFIIGRWVGTGFYSRHEAEANIMRAAQDAGCDNPTKDRDCMMRALDAGVAQPETIPDKPLEPLAIAADDEVDDDEVWSAAIDDLVIHEGKASDLAEFDLKAGRRERRKRFDMYTLPEIISREFPVPNYVIPGLLSEGLNLLAGKPKLGKSMLALNMAITIAGGGRVMGNIQTVPGDVLYLSLEDKERRVQYRARKMANGLDVSISRRLTVATAFPSQGHGGLQLIDLWAKRSERPILVIVDVWSKFKPMYNPKGSQYEQDYRQLSALKDFLGERSCSVLVIMHCRKGGADDVLEEISGTMGLSGVADGIIVLARVRQSNDAQIFITGRDVEDHELALRFDPETLVWKSLGSAEEFMTGELQIKIVEYLKSRREEKVFVAAIAEAIASTGDSVRRVLHRLREKGIVRQEGFAWVYPGIEEEIKPGEGAY